MKNSMSYTYGLKRGVPIALGYFTVSFGFGISAVMQGLFPYQAVLTSIANLTSAGQVAGVGVMVGGGLVLEMILAQLIINIRYALMGIALTQRLDEKFTLKHRIIAAFGITDEVFIMAASERDRITPKYMYGLITLPILGWTAGTALGAFLGQVLPQSASASLSLAIYFMFVAIIVPPSRKDKNIMVVVLISAAASCAIYYIEFLKKYISSGFSVIICAVVASLVMAKIGKREESEDEDFE